MEKTQEQIALQMERIYTLYGRGYGTKKMLEQCESKFYKYFIKIGY